MPLFAQKVFYTPVVGEQKVYNNPRCNFSDLSSDKTPTCKSIEKDILPRGIPYKGAVFWDCGKTDKNGNCSYNKLEEKNPEDIKMFFVEYYFFDDVQIEVDDGKFINVCDEIDQAHGYSFRDMAARLLQSGLEQKQPYSKIFDQIDRYLSKKTYNKVYDRQIEKFVKKRIFRNDCFVHDRGWVQSDLMKPSLDKDPNALLLPTQAQLNSIDHCNECKNANKSVLHDLYADAEKIVKELDALDKTDRRSMASVIDKCNGTIELQSISIKFEKTRSGCEITFPEGCSDGNRLRKFEEITNNILFSQAVNSKIRCRDAEKAFRNDCGLNKGLAEGGRDKRKDKQLERFSEVRKKVQNVLGRGKGPAGVNEGVLMCLFNMETTTYDASMINYTSCEPGYFDSSHNLKERNKLGSQRPGDFIFKGWVSSAHGLGQVTLETACESMKINPTNYPELAGAKDLDCKSPKTKKAVEKIFMQSGEDEDLQIRLAADTIGFKLKETGKNLKNAIQSYNGDPNSDSYFADFVMTCSNCFARTKKSPRTDLEINRCINATRDRILPKKDSK